jgi:hypothetical protein
VKGKKNMIEKIKTLFGRDSVSFTPDQNTYMDYSWFLTESQEIFGIKNNRISEEQKSLLTGLFTKLDSDSVLMPTAHNEWLDY